MALPSRGRETVTSRPPAVWAPFRELDELQRRTADLRRSVWSALRAGGGRRCAPAVDLEETGGTRIVEAELAGVRRDDVTVELAVHTVRVPDPEQATAGRAVIEAREA